MDTGEETLTGGRLKRVAAISRKPSEAFCMTYGDGLADVDIAAASTFIRSHGKTGDGDRGASARTLRRARP